MASETPMPVLDTVSIAKTTRKTLERLIPFSHMQLAPATADEQSTNSNPIVNKILTKVNTYIRTIDESMLAMQVGYDLSSEGMMFCDLGLAGTKKGKEVDVDQDQKAEEEDSWDVGVSVESLRDKAKRGYELVQGVQGVWREISQEVFKIAAYSKDSMVLVSVPPDPSHAGTITKNLKDIGTDLVANLNLLSEFSRAVASTEEWWDWVKADLDSEHASSLYPSPGGARGDKVQAWANMRETFQEYYNIIHPLHTRFPAMLGSSSKAWGQVATAAARNLTPTNSQPHSRSNSLENLSSTPARTKPSGWFFGRAAWGFLGMSPKMRVKEGKERSSSRSPTLRLNEKTGSGNNSAEVPEPKSSFSCRSGGLFEDMVGNLGCHAFLSR